MAGPIGSRIRPEKGVGARGMKATMTVKTAVNGMKDSGKRKKSIRGNWEVYGASTVNPADSRHLLLEYYITSTKLNYKT